MIEAIRTVRSLLPYNTSVTTELIEEKVDIALSIPQYAGVNRDQLITAIRLLYNVRMEEFRMIEAQERRRPWLNERRTQIWRQGYPSFWSRYREYLAFEKNYPLDVLNRLDRLTDRILDSLFDPVPNVVIDKRGLVVGQVQSGKTSNYTGLICKAADAGYKLIIVLAGIHNNLRSQTQLRMDEGFLGFDTQHQRAFNQNNRWMGVGHFDPSMIAHSLTSSSEKGDFNAGAATALGLNFNTNEPIIAVVKKNASVLNRLFQWLVAQSVEGPGGRRTIRNKSLLLIDDEADNASINTRAENDGATRINELIRNILRIFDKSGYIGYTATPFANIFIPITEDDLFPRDFIVNLPAPSNYIGPEKVFGFEPAEDDASENVLPIIRRIDDQQVLIEPENPDHVPDSLRIALKCFIITCAVRRLRGHTHAHNTMLIHISRLIGFQRQIRELVNDLFDFYRRGIEMNIENVIEEMRIVYEQDSPGYNSYLTTSHTIRSGPLSDIDSFVPSFPWSEINAVLNEAAARISVREINGGSADTLSYYDNPNGLSVIAIGGDKLSRGLTLEGLSVSYYLRTSKMYDTLMQMGRWFGYRPGYVDLCRLFISKELNEWFCHITLASEQLRDEFDYMADVAGSTPDQFALRVRTHPGVLQISASNKIRRAVEVQVSWSGRLVESYELSKNVAVLQRNLNTASTMINSLRQPAASGRNFYLWRDISLLVIKDFLRTYQTYDNLKSAAPANLLRFIEMNERFDELNNWAVAIISKERTTNRYIINQLDIGLIVRTQDGDKSNENVYYIPKSHIISPGDEFIDLSEQERQQALIRTQQIWTDAQRSGSPAYPSGEVVRNTIRKPNRPLLLLYFLDPAGAAIQGGIPIIGYAISFPANDRDDAVSFAVHEQLLNQFNQQDEPEITQSENDEN